MTVYLANDKYRATLRSGWVSSPADATLSVDAIPANLPTIVVVGWTTIYETVFSVTGTSGTNSSNYALTGVARIKGADANIPEGAAVNCLNNEEFFNQYNTALAAVQSDVTTAETNASSAVTTANAAADSALAVTATASIASPTPTRTKQRNLFELTAQAVTGTFQPPTGTAQDGDTLLIRIKDNGTARALVWNGTAYAAGGVALPANTTTGKYLHLGFQYVTSNSLNKWMLLGSAQEA